MRVLLTLLCLLTAIQAADARHRRHATDTFFMAPPVKELETIVAPDGRFVDPRYGFVSSVRPGPRSFEAYTPGIVSDFGQICTSHRERFVLPDGRVFINRQQVLCQ